jgi:hypothetical protein
MIQFAPQSESTRYSTYSIRNTTPSHSTGSLVTEPVSHQEHTEVDSANQEYFAFKILPSEYPTFEPPAADDDDDADGETGESCRDMANRIVRRIRGQSLAGFTTVDKDIVRYDFHPYTANHSLDEAQRSTSIISRVDYAVKRFLWL